MTHIPVNFDETPDEFTAIPPGIYSFVVESAVLEPTAAGDGEKVVVVLKVDDADNEQNGRIQKEHMGISNPKGGGAIALKRLARSAGLSPGVDGLDLEDLIGQTVKARIKARVYPDKDTGEIRETSAVAEFLVDAD